MTPSGQPPWWWKEIHRDPQLCEVDLVRVQFRNKSSKQVTVLEMPFLLLRLLKELLAMRGKYDYVFSMECDFVGLGVAFWQALLLMRRPRHVIVQFIMRERTLRVSSRLKYVLMRLMFGSVHRVICSSRVEVDYYRNVFNWTADKARFVPLPTSADWLETPNPATDGDYVVAAGRVYRDFRTAADAVRGTPFRLVIIGGAGVRREIQADEQIEVLEEIPHQEFSILVRHALAVIVPLVDKKISAGQLVLLQAMAMGKLVIATRTAGTDDYVTHMSDGILVEPGDVLGMRRALHAAASHELRLELGSRARERMAKCHMPQHYTAAVRRVVASRACES